MDYSFQTRFGTISIGEETLKTTFNNLVDSLICYKVNKIEYSFDQNGLMSAYIYVTNDHPSVNYIDYVNKFQTSLKKAIETSLNISNFYSIVVID